MDENERVVCEFLRKIAPPREWEYLGEVEHYWISQLCDELNKQLKAENAKLKRRLEILKGHGIEIVDAVAGGFEIYNNEHARADRLQAENAKLRDELRKMDQWHSAELTAALDENAKLRDIAHKTWRLLLATGNDDLVLSIEANGEVKELIDADELAKAMRELGIETQQ